MTMSIEQLRVGLRERALKKRKLAAGGVLSAQFATHEDLQHAKVEQEGNLSFRVLERDGSGGLKSFAVRTEHGAEFIFKVTARDNDGAIKSFSVVR